MENSRCSLQGELSTEDVAAQYKHKNAIIDVKVDTESNISATLTFTDIAPSTNTSASLKLFDNTLAKLELQYFHDHATFKTAIGLNGSPVIDVFCAFAGIPSIAIGAEAGYDTTSGCFTKYTAGISLTKCGSSASIILGDKVDIIRASVLLQLKKSAAFWELTRRFSTNEITYTVGGSFAINHLTHIKARLNNHGKLGVLLQREVLPKSVLTISGEVDTKALNPNPRFGLSILLLSNLDFFTPF